MAYETTPNAMKPLPAAAAQISVAGNATPWASSAYGQLSAGLGAAAILANIVPGFAALTGPVEFEFDIATGAAASEVVIATYRGVMITQAVVNPWQLLPLIDNLPSARISFRFRKSDTTTSSSTMSINYFLQASFGAEVTAQPYKVLPAAADGVLLTPNYSTTDYGTCPWGELTSGLANAIVISGVVAFAVSNPSASRRHIIEIAKGASGQEQIIARFSQDHRVSAGYRGHYGAVWFPVLLDNVPASTRLAIRVIPGSGTTAPNWRAALSYLEKPL